MFKSSYKCPDTGRCLPLPLPPASFLRRGHLPGQGMMAAVSSRKPIRPLKGTQHLYGDATTIVGTRKRTARTALGVLLDRYNVGIRAGDGQKGGGEEEDDVDGGDGADLGVGRIDPWSVDVEPDD